MIKPAPKSTAEHRARWPAAIAKVWDWRGVKHVDEKVDRPGARPEHIFDWHDGLRLLASTDRYDFGTLLHVSASANVGTPLYRLLMRQLRASGSPDVFLAFQKEVLGRLEAVGQVRPVLAFFSLGKMVPHWFDPAWPADVGVPFGVVRPGKAIREAT